MSGSTLIEILVILVLILANGSIAASEIGVVSARRSQLERQVAAGKRGARRALALAQKPEYFLATVGIGIELIGTFTEAFGGDRLAATLEEWLATLPAPAGQPGLRPILALLGVVLPITFLTMLLGELIPKRLALRHAVGMATFSAPLLTAMGRLLGPLVALLTAAVTLGYEGGKRKRKSFYSATQREVQAQLKKALHDQQQGLPVSFARQALEEFLARRLEDSVKPSVHPSTYTGYEVLVRVHIVPELGKIQLVQLLIAALRSNNRSA